jgi:hypothetical protein
MHRVRAYQKSPLSIRRTRGGGLPDTGGGPVLPLIAGLLLVGAGLLARLSELKKRRDGLIDLAHDGPLSKAKLSERLIPLDAQIGGSRRRQRHLGAKRRSCWIGRRTSA